MSHSSALRWLDQPPLRRLWDAAAARLERNGVLPRGELRLADAAVEEREALQLLLGRQFPARAVLRVDLAELDARLHDTALGLGLVATLDRLQRPVVDRAARRRSDAARWAGLWQAAIERVDRQWPVERWPSDWLEDLRRAGALARLEPPAASEVLSQAIDVLAALPPGALCGRGELAHRATGTAHGLDDGTVLARVVLRGIAAREGEDPRTALDGAAARRRLWRAAGVVVDEVSSTVLTLGLAPLGGGWRERSLRERSSYGVETHLSARDVAALDWSLPAGTLVRVCENPRVVEAAAGRPVPLVCTAGNPTTVTTALLEALRDAGADLAYHGDFDWPGLAIANRVVGLAAARPWRMGADDYEQAVAAAGRAGVRLVELEGRSVAALWDGELEPAMRSCGRAVHEEFLLDELLADLLG